MDDDKWFSVIGEAMDTSPAPNLVEDSIALTEITEYDSIYQQQPQTIPKKTKKNSYFVLDQDTILSADEIQGQLMNTEDIVSEKQLMSDSFKVKPSDNLNKLLKTPERGMPAKLASYYTKNLKTSTKNIEDDMNISYDDIQRDVQRTLANRHKNKDTFMDATDDDQIDYQINNSEVDPRRSILSSIDRDFRPKVSFSEGTYSRKKLVK